MANIGSIYRAHVMRTLLKEAAGNGPLGYDGFAATGAHPQSSINVNRPKAPSVQTAPQTASPAHDPYFELPGGRMVPANDTTGMSWNHGDINDAHAYYADEFNKLQGNPHPEAIGDFRGKLDEWHRAPNLQARLISQAVRKKYGPALDQMQSDFDIATMPRQDQPGIMDQLKGYLGQAGQYASDHPYLTGAGLIGGGLGLKALYDYLNQDDEDEDQAYLPVKMGAAGGRDFFGSARRS